MKQEVYNEFYKKAKELYHKIDFLICESSSDECDRNTLRELIRTWLDDDKERI